VWPTLGSRTSKEQNRTEQMMSYLGSALSVVEFDLDVAGDACGSRQLHDERPARVRSVDTRLVRQRPVALLHPEIRTCNNNLPQYWWSEAASLLPLANYSLLAERQPALHSRLRLLWLSSGNKHRFSGVRHSSRT